MIPTPSLNLSIIGNGVIAGLLDRFGNIVWSCWPRIDGDPIFCALVDGENPESGYLSVSLDEECVAEQFYIRNTAIVRTVVRSRSGDSFQITDFVPRFRQYHRLFKPPMILRCIEPLQGLCSIHIRCCPRMNYGSKLAAVLPGSNHIRYMTEYGSIRLTSDGPITHIANETSFVLSHPIVIIIHEDEVLADSISRVWYEFFQHTQEYWEDWVRTLDISFVLSLDGDEIDASVLLLQELGLVSSTDERFISTVEMIGKKLGRDEYVYRYETSDDYRLPDVAFTICTFWYVGTLVAIGQEDEARKLFEKLLSRVNHVGLLSEDIDPKTGELWGNFPQIYSMSGLIVCSIGLFRGWEDAR